MATVLIAPDTAPAIGDVRALGTGDTILLRDGWSLRKDSGRYAGAIADAVSHGADARHFTPDDHAAVRDAS
jgi:hypothetical protein